MFTVYRLRFNSLRSFTLLRLGIESELSLLSLCATVSVYGWLIFKGLMNDLCDGRLVNSRCKSTTGALRSTNFHEKKFIFL